MMDFMDSLKRGVDRAGFEVDRLLRANRVRARINTLRSQMDEEERQIGRRVVELHEQGEQIHPDLADHCERVKLCRQEIVEREAELDAINREMPPLAPEEAPPSQAQPQPEPPQPGTIACHNCGATLPEEAVFCLRCGANVKAATQTPPPPPEA